MKNKSNKENRASLERRLSLKYSSAGPKAKHRMSIPMRRESVGAFSEIQHKNVDPSYELRQSLVSTKSQMLFRPHKKQAIMTNLINKLQNQDDLKTIIESKMKKIQKNHAPVYDQEAIYLSQKLKTCEEEIDQFKTIVRHLTQKIATLQENKTPIKIGFKTTQPTLHSTAVQTQPNIHIITSNHLKESAHKGAEFMENLDQTLKLLSNHKKL